MGSTTVLSGWAASRLTGLLVFGTATLLCLVTEELLVSAHEVQETPLITTFFSGFLAIIVVELPIHSASMSLFGNRVCNSPADR